MRQCIRVATATSPPAAPEVLVFYTAAEPLIERLLAMARAWRDRSPTDPEAIRAHSETAWLAIRCDLRRNRYRAPGSAGAPTTTRRTP
jgi:hypothetical protein